MSSPPVEWYEEWIELVAIRDGIEDPKDKADFIKEIEKMKAEGKKDIDVVNHYVRKGKENVKGYVKLTADNIGPLRSYRSVPSSAPSTSLGIDIPPEISIYGEYGTPYPNRHFQPEANPPVIYNRSGPRPSYSSGSERTATTLYGAPPAPANDPYRHYSYPNNPNQDNPYQTNPYSQSTARPDDSIPEAARPYTSLTDYVEQEPGKKPKTSNEQASRRSRGSPPSSHGHDSKRLKKSGGRSDLRGSRR